MKKWLAIAFIFADFLLIGVSAVLPTAGETEIYRDVVRFHIRADSDSEEDQRIKMQVRDRIIGDLEAIAAGCRDMESAAAALEARLPEIQAAAEAAYREAGGEGPVRVSLGEKYFGEREYDGVTLPAGSYRSVIVELGSGAGQNFWCVVFPPLCTGDIDTEGLLKAGLSQEEIDFITEGEKPVYVFKFKFLEWFSKWFGK